MRLLTEYLSTKVKQSIIHATDETIHDIIDSEVKRLGLEADLNHIDTSKVTTLKNALSAIGGFIERDGKRGWGEEWFNCDISKWDVSNVTYMSELFSFCYKFNKPLDAWDVSKVKYMYRMFYCCLNFNQPLDTWDVSNVEDMRSMFAGASSFNQDISMWNAKNITKKFQKQNIFSGKCPIKEEYKPKFKI